MYKYNLYDTIVCSYSRFEEFVRLMDLKAVDDRSKVIANMNIPHDYIFYVDSDGIASKYYIEQGEH